MTKLFAAKPSYTATTGYQSDSKPEYLETQYFGYSFQMGSLTGGTSVDGGDVNGFKILVHAAKDGAAALQCVPGPDPACPGSPAHQKGKTAIDAGRIVLGHNLALQNSPINTDNVGKIDATGFTTPTFGGLKGSANLSTMITSGYSGITTLTLNTVNTDAALATAGKTLTTFAGAITDGAAGMNLVKSGAGTQTLNGINTYSGATTINGGTLALGAAGSIDNTTGVSLGTNGTFDVSLKSGGYTVSNLSGSGTVKGALSVSTQLSIGNSPGTASFDSGLTLDSAAYIYEMTGGATPGVGSADLANITGTLTITAGSILDLVELGTYTLGNKLTLFGYTTGITGTFDGLVDGAEFNDDLANKWQIDYNDTTAGLNGGIGTSFVTITAVPEPGAALLSGLGLLALLRRRRQS